MAQTYTFKIPAGTTASALLAKAREAGRSKGVALAGDDARGTFTGPAEGTYEVRAGDLAVTVTKKPTFMPWGMIEAALQDLFGRA